MPYLTVNEAKYHFAMRGSGEPLVLLHGFSGSWENWRRHAEVFASHYLTISIDLLGHGRSQAVADAGRYQMNRCIEDVVGILQSVGAAPTNVLGYSMGGRLALGLALAYPSLVNRLILESASPGLEGDDERRARIAHDERLADAIERDGVEAFVNYWEQIPLFASQASLAPAIKGALREQRRQNQVVGLANSLRGMGTGVQPSFWSRLTELQMPVLLMAGELDPKFCQLARQMAAIVPKARLEIISESGHTIHLEQPKQFDDLVLAFLRAS